MTNKTTFILTPAQEERLVAVIREAESHTSGEIRVHIEPSCEADAFARGLEVFAQLGMQHTRQRNAVLIYIAYESRRYAIVADIGINRVVADGFWDTFGEQLTAAFRAGQFLHGLESIILPIGQALAAHFPRTPDDTDELPNDVSQSKA